MITFGPLARAGAAVAVGGLVLGLSAIPAGSQVIEESGLSVGGAAECDVVDGVDTWFVTYIASNTTTIGIPANAPAAYGDIDIVAQQAVLNGGTPFNTDLVPDPVPLNGTASYVVELPGSTTGTLVLTVDWVSTDTEAEGSEVVTIQLDDRCVAPATTTTTGAPAVQAVTVTPAFTG